MQQVIIHLFDHGRNELAYSKTDTCGRFKTGKILIGPKTQLAIAGLAGHHYMLPQHDLLVLSQDCQLYSYSGWVWVTRLDLCTTLAIYTILYNVVSYHALAPSDTNYIDLQDWTIFGCAGSIFGSQIWSAQTKFDSTF